jgi:uncharacterized protein YktA (UPF0223 family)
MKKKKNTFGEAYTIKATYQKEDGFWTTIEITQVVEVVHGVNEKCNHDKAATQFLKENKHLKNLKIKSVGYE